MSLQPGKITPELTQADTPGGPRLEIVNTEYRELEHKPETEQTTGICNTSLREAFKKKTIFFVTNVTLWGGVMASVTFVTKNGVF